MGAEMIILDIDNCIADDAWRIPRINFQHADPDRRYHDYHALAPWDKRGNEALFLNREDIAIFTARPVAFFAPTAEWLQRNGVRWQHLLMRNAGDHRHSVELKAQQLRWLLVHYDVEPQDIECAYDDREDVCAMYREAGLKAERRWIHSVCAHTAPMVKA